MSDKILIINSVQGRKSLKQMEKTWLMILVGRSKKPQPLGQKHRFSKKPET